MSIKDRIREAASLKSMTLKDLSDAIGIPYRSLQNYISGERGVSVEFLEAITTRLGISSDWLLTGVEPAFLSEKHPIERQTVSISEKDRVDFISIPRLAVQASAGHGAVVEDVVGTGAYAFNRKWLVRRGLNKDHLAIISVKGDSMEPGFANGDLILIDRAQTIPADGLVFVFRLSGDLFVKNVQTLPGNKLQLISQNKFYPPITADLTEDQLTFQVVGRVVASMHEW
jgi:phage repressor protein C with HTH and peptisase S24 domain